jgi:hypothetical protein
MHQMSRIFEAGYPLFEKTVREARRIRSHDKTLETGVLFSV